MSAWYTSASARRVQEYARYEWVRMGALKIWYAVSEHIDLNCRTLNRCISDLRWWDFGMIQTYKCMGDGSVMDNPFYFPFKGGLGTVLD